MSVNHRSRFIPIIASICVVIGIIIGNFFAIKFNKYSMSIGGTSADKLNNLLHIVDEQYVDTVNMNNIIEEAMPSILQQLDPHSVYISAKDAERSNEDLKGSFSGIGVKFTMLDDTLHINNIIKNGPAEKAGLIAGDYIITVNDSCIAGKKLSSEKIMSKLKGAKGSTVMLGVKRIGEKDIRKFKVVRDDIPIYSVESSYMMNNKTGYIKIKSFSETTYQEMLLALTDFGKQHMQSLIIDLRGNNGGYMGEAIMMVNEFLPKGRLIVYTQGRKAKRQDYYSDGHGTFQDLPLVVLMDEFSASASEIFAGAIQDNDRGTIVGRRSFGKGLVQQPITFNDGSVVRLTIARYYTPSGRCIQKPYENGKDENYEKDILQRYEHGEFFSQDSIKQKGEAFKTRIGRTVYGGGGITPDIFVAEDTTNVTNYYAQARMFIPLFTQKYIEGNRTALNKINSVDDMEKMLKKQNIVETFVLFADKKGLKRRNLMIKKSHQLLEESVINSIIYFMLDDNASCMYLNKYDKTMQRAIDIINSGKSVPTLQKKEDKTKK